MLQHVAESYLGRVVRDKRAGFMLSETKRTSRIRSIDGAAVDRQM